MNSSKPQTLDQAEDRLQQALREGDVTALDLLLDESVVFVGPDGHEVGKNEDLEAHRLGTLRFNEVNELHRATREFDTAGITRVTLHLVGEAGGRPLDANLVYTRTWILDDDSWRVVQAQGAVVQ
jgi:ketosteroid isomerase-like protein